MPNKQIDEMGIHRNEQTDELEGGYTQPRQKDKILPAEPQNGGMSISTVKVLT